MLILFLITYLTSNRLCIKYNFLTFAFSPLNPQEMDWSRLYPQMASDGGKVEFADVGCGYGGLLGKHR